MQYKTLIVIIILKLNEKLFKVTISGAAGSGKTTHSFIDGNQNLVNYHVDKVLMLFNKFFISSPLYQLEDLIGDKKVLLLNHEV